jgi:non-specific serine/threonine protein kinase
MASDLLLFCATRGVLGEGRCWLDEALAATPPDATAERVEALYNASLAASEHGDLPAAAARVKQARSLIERLTDPAARGLVDIADGYAALLSGEPDRARHLLEAAVDRCGDLTKQATGLVLLASAYDSLGDAEVALAVNQRVLELSEAHGESVIRSWALWSVGIEHWRKDNRKHAADALKRGLHLAEQLRDARMTASHLEVLAWIAADDGKPVPAAILMAAAETVGPPVGNYTSLLPNLPAFHQECYRRVHSMIDAPTFDAAREKGRSMSFADAVVYACSLG